MGPRDIMQEFSGTSPTAENNGSPGEMQSAFAVDVHRAMPLAKAPSDVDEGLPTLTKAELAELVFEHVGLNKRDAKDMVEAFFDEIRSALERGELVKLTNDALSATAELCEGALRDSHTPQKLRRQYAVVTYLATFKATVKKVPGQPRETILRDLVASQPGNEGKWFAAAKDAGYFEMAIELANRSPSDPRTLICAAKDFAVERLSLRWRPA